MPIRTAIWKVGQQPQPLAETSLASERLLEDMILAAPRILSTEWMLIGRQEDTGFGGRIDLLAECALPDLPLPAADSGCHARLGLPAQAYAGTPQEEQSLTSSAWPQRSLHDPAERGVVR